VHRAAEAAPMKHTGRFLLAMVIAGVATAAFSGGPIYTFDPVNRIPYAWNLASWPDGQVPLYTDLGDLGVVTSERANEMVAFAAEQWSIVPTSAFRTTVAGNFGDLGLYDIDASTVTTILGTWNGGGMHVIYDADGTIMSDFFGLPPTGVLGITNIDYVGVDSPEILEAWMVLSGPGIHANDPNGIGFQGVVTHEMGHAINLGHSQTNGAVWNPNVYDSPQPQGCSAPWTGGASSGQVETMYAISTPEPGNSGEYMGTVDMIDDMTAISDLYPAPGYPGNRGTIKGQILDSNGAPVIAVDVIARNVAYPFDDCTSYISGQITKGDAGPDGSFELNGLTPGGRYAIYVDNLLIGAYAVPRQVVLPGVEEYFNGKMESGDSAKDNHCAWTTVVAAPGAPVTANITFNKYAGAPTLITAPANSYPNDITPDGFVVVGGLSSMDGPIFRWDLNADTFENIGGFRVGTPSISDDGTKIASSVEDTDGTIRAAIHENGAWTIIPPVPGSTPCSQDGKTSANSAWDISGDGSTVVGMNYGDSCFRGGIRAFKWTAASGSVALPKFSSFNMLSRANGVNYDGSVIVGHDETTSGAWRGAFWKDGIVKLITRLGQNVAPAVDVSRDGLYIVGQSSLASSKNAWRYSVVANTVELLGSLPSHDNAVTIAISDDHNVIVGYSTSSSTGATVPAIWTPGLHWSSFNTFLLAQGVNLTDTYPYGPTAMSADGRVITGTLVSIFGDIGFVVKTPTAIVCHAPAGSPTQLQTTIVGFPLGLDEALANGDTLGPCQCNSAAPTGIPKITIGKSSAGNARVNWSATASATGYDLARGGLEALRTSNGDFSTAATDCLENDLTGTSRDDADTPDAGDGFWYLVRAANCGGSSTFDSGAASQIGSRDAEIQASPSTCP
jgi:uncharacterized membrane protein